MGWGGGGWNDGGGKGGNGWSDGYNRDDAGQSEKSALIDKIKELQKGNHPVKSAWEEYANAEGGGNLGVAKHEAPFLQRFLDLMVEKDLGLTRNELIEKVKDLQRISGRVKKAWEDLCNTEGDGCCIPGKHNDAYLKRFISECAAKGMDKPPNPSMDLVNEVKQFQRNSGGREVWQTYCDEVGEYHDPGKHEDEFLRNFLAKHSGAQAQASPLVLQDSDSPLLRRVKHGQNISLQLKLAWRDYCDAKGGDHDPSKNADAFLQEYVDTFLVPDASAKWVLPAPAPDVLIDQLNALLSADDSAWNTFCKQQGGGVNDPKKHDLRKLLQFIMRNGAKRAGGAGGEGHSSEPPAKHQRWY